tara:strand:+ start:616 stop:807 length:192 start_codon:yes stop_codon:yes gene_type:complete
LFKDRTPVKINEIKYLNLYSKIREMKKVFVVIFILGFMAAFTACQTQQDCPNYGQLKTEQTRS